MTRRSLPIICLSSAEAALYRAWSRRSEIALIEIGRGPNWITARAVNIGRSTARELEATLAIDGEYFRSGTVAPVLAPGRHHVFRFDVPKLSTRDTAEATVILSETCLLRPRFRQRGSLDHRAFKPATRPLRP
jgi:hypothetical protein